MTWLLTHLELGIDKSLILAANRLDNAAFDYSFVHDLFEHLSVAAIERALRELLRVTRREVWFHLFNAADVTCHNVRPVASYHWNLLSIGEVVRVCHEFAPHVEVVSIAELARQKFGFGRYYNPGAHTIVAVKETADPTRRGHGLWPG